MRAIGRQRTSLVRLTGGGLWRVRGPTSSVRNRKWTYLINRPDDLKSLPSRRKTHLNRRGHPLGLPGWSYEVTAPWQMHSGDGCDS